MPKAKKKAKISVELEPINTSSFEHEDVGGQPQEPGSHHVLSFQVRAKKTLPTSIIQIQWVRPKTKRMYSKSFSKFINELKSALKTHQISHPEDLTIVDLDNDKFDEQNRLFYSKKAIGNIGVPLDKNSYNGFRILQDDQRLTILIDPSLANPSAKKVEDESKAADRAEKKEAKQSIIKAHKDNMNILKERYSCDSHQGHKWCFQSSENPDLVLPLTETMISTWAFCIGETSASLENPPVSGPAARGFLTFFKPKASRAIADDEQTFGNEQSVSGSRNVSPVTN
jgi:hypothetical protein